MKLAAFTFLLLPASVALVVALVWSHASPVFAFLGGGVG